jgi:YD repeat-containing protein
VDASGRVLTFTFTGDKLTRIQDPLGRSVIYNYDNQGFLSEVTDLEGGITRYTYDGAGEALAAIAQRLGLTYSAVSRRVRTVERRLATDRRWGARLAELSDVKVKT